VAHVVCEPCVDCKYTDCVEVCPVECFHQGSRALYIDPEVCIDCALCVPECPVEAIYADVDVPEKWKSSIELNAAGARNLPVITQKQDPLPSAPPRKTW